MIVNARRVKAKLRLEACVVARVRTGKVLGTIEARTEGKTKAERLAIEDLEERKLLAANDAVTKVAAALSTAVLAKIGGRN